MKLPLSYGFGIISVAAVLATAIGVALLAVNATNSMIGDTIGSHTVTMREFSRSQIEAHFEAMTTAATEMQAAVRFSDAMPFPAEDSDPNKFVKWWNIIEPFVLVDPRVVHVIVLLHDNTVIRVKVFQVPSGLGDGKFVPVVTSYGWDAAARRAHFRSRFLSNRSSYDHVATYPFPNVNSSTFPALLYPRQFIAENEGDRYWMSMGITAFPTQVNFPVGAILHNASLTKLGPLMVAISTETLNALLKAAADAVDGSLAVVVDAEGYVAGSSDDSAPTTNRTDYDSREGLGVSRACSVTPPVDPQIYVICRRTVQEYAADTIPELLSAYRQTSATINVSSFVVGDYNVEHRQLRNSVDVNFVLHLYVLYPRSYLLSSLQRVVNLIIIVTTAVAATFAVLAVLAGNVMVRPLGKVTRQMDELSRLQFSGRWRTRPSIIQEVARLQAASAALTEELLKISSYVPMNLRDAPAAAMLKSSSDLSSVHRHHRKDGVPPTTFAHTSSVAPGGGGGAAAAARDGTAFVDVSGEANPLRRSSATTTVTGSDSKDNDDIGGASTAIERSAAISAAALNAAPNQFAAKKFAYMVVSIVDASTDSLRDTDKCAALLSEAFLAAIRRHRGVVERFEPRCCAASFGAHGQTFSPQRQATEAAISVAAALRKDFEPGAFSVVVDCATGLVGTFGTSTTRTVAVFGDVVRYCAKLTDLCRSFLPVSVLLTERVASAVTRGTVLPIDVVRFYSEKLGAVEETSVALFTVSDVEQSSEATPALAREIFAELRCGNFNFAADPRVRSSASPVLQRIRAAAAFAIATNREEYFRCEGPTRWEPAGEDGPHNSRTTATSTTAERSATGSGGSDGTGGRPPSRTLTASLSGMAAPPAPTVITPADIARTMRAAQDESANEEPQLSDGIISVFTDREVELPMRIRDMTGEEWERARLPSHVGKSSALYHAFSAVTGAPVVLKVLPLDASADTSGYEREVAAQARLSHECVVTNISYAVMPGYFVLVRELVAGGSLAEVLAAHGTVCLPVLRRYVRDIVLGLQHLHQFGVIHLDLRPGTVLLGGDGRCKLTGFASSEVGRPLGADSRGSEGDCSSGCEATDMECRIREAQQRHQHHGGSGGGARNAGVRRAFRPPYVAPEVARGEQPTGASDVYTLAIVTLELHLGSLRTVFPDFHAQSVRDDIAFMTRIVRDRSFRPRIPVSGMPPDLFAFVEACAEADPGKRPTAAALLRTPFLSSL